MGRTDAPDSWCFEGIASAFMDNVAESKMKRQVEGRSLGWSLLVVLALSSGAALAADPVQTLGRADVFNRTNVLETDFDQLQATVLNITGTALKACQITAVDGLVCLESNGSIGKWADPESATGPGTVLVSCADPALGLDTKKPEPCSAMTVDQSRVISIAGRIGNFYSLIKLAEKPCSSNAWTAIPNRNYCFRSWVSGRPQITDISAADGQSGLANPLGPGTLGIEGTDLLFYDDEPNVAPIVVVPGKVWNLTSQETVQSAALMPLKVGSDPPTFVTYYVVSTSKGRVLAARAGAAPAAASFEVYKKSACTATTAPQYTVRVNSNVDRVYLTDRNCHQVLALERVASPDSRPFMLAVNATIDTGTAIDSATVAPGIVVDLTLCAGEVGCTVLKDSAGNPAFRMNQVHLAPGSADKVTLFQVKDVDDCRFTWTAACQAALDTPYHGQPLIVGTGSAQYLNISPLLPLDVKLIYEPAGLPPMFLSPRYRALPPNFTLDMLIGKGEAGLRFDRPFLADFEDSLGGYQCNYESSPPVTIEDYRKFGVVATISEQYVTVGGPNGLAHVEMLTNSGCGGKTITSGRWSAYLYNLEVTPTDDRVLLSLLGSLSNDWEATRAQLVCQAFDVPSGPAPLGTTCSSLKAAWALMDKNLDKCIQDLTLNSNNAANCNSFETQMRSFIPLVEAQVASGPDPANRVSELKVRERAINDLYFRRVKPSYLQ
jgi:hypothetical protein